jgi:Flp pilus assembly protein TadG
MFQTRNAAIDGGGTNAARATTTRRPRWRMRRRRGEDRRASATVELAICLPVLLIFALGPTELCNLLYTRQRALTACYDGVRLAVRPRTAQVPAATAAQVRTRVETALGQLGVQGATVEIVPADLTNLAPQTQVTVRALVPTNQNSITAYVLQTNLTLQAQATMIVE